MHVLFILEIYVSTNTECYNWFDWSFTRSHFITCRSLSNSEKHLRFVCTTGSSSFQVEFFIVQDFLAANILVFKP